MFHFTAKNNNLAVSNKCTNMNYDIIIIGSGPGGYVAAIRASQLGMKVGVIEKAELGGVCLNWGCIPTKALLKSAQVFKYASQSANYGIEIEGNINANFSAIIQHSRGVAENMSKGIHFLFKKNKINYIAGFAKVLPNKKVEVTNSEGIIEIYKAEHIIIATGAKSKELSGLKQDGKKIIGYREALSLEKQPESMLVVGSGAIGTELAYFYNTIGTQITLVEYLPYIVPMEDEEAT